MTREASLQTIRSLRTLSLPPCQIPRSAVEHAPWMERVVTMPPPLSVSLSSSEALVWQHVERQRLFARLVAASSASHNQLPLAERLHLRSTMPPLGPSLENSLSPQVNQYVLMRTLHRLEQELQAQPPSLRSRTSSQRDHNVNGRLQARPSAPGSSFASLVDPCAPNTAVAASHASVAITAAQSVASSFGVDSTSVRDEIPLCVPVLLSRPADIYRLSARQVWLRQQIQIFGATEPDISTHIRGRNKSVRLGQVGLQCRHCAHRPIVQRPKGSTYFPSSVHGIYQASQNMMGMHFSLATCPDLPVSVQEQRAQLWPVSDGGGNGSRNVPTSGAGRLYWAETAMELGLVDTDMGIYFAHALPRNVSLIAPSHDNGLGNYRKCAAQRSAPKKQE
jgi:hypothetical protein